ncbi:MAG: hypothetical protein JSS66_05220 [Armatimonadetes bacterium]|nr:hypothetical protein [Armatimonadota bacterium]
MADSNKEKQVVQTILVPGLRNITRSVPVDKRKYIQDLTGNETPLEPLPPDPFEGVMYPTFHENKCAICSSPYRTKVEHVFLANGESPAAVAHYFWRYYGAMVNPVAVKHHMHKHCVLTEIISSGLSMLQKRAEEFDWWRLRRSELVITGLLAQIDRIEAIRTKNQPDLELKKSAEMRALLAAYSQAQKQFEEESTEVMSVQHILADLMNLIQDEASKDIIRSYVRELRQKIREETV